MRAPQVLLVDRFVKIGVQYDFGSAYSRFELLFGAEAE